MHAELGSETEKRRKIRNLKRSHIADFEQNDNIK